MVWICAGKSVDNAGMFLLLLSVTGKHCQFHPMKLVFREVNVLVAALCSHSIHLAVCKLLKEEMGTLLFHFQSKAKACFECDRLCYEAGDVSLF